ncbi:S-adenosyl-L-methionine-dependent methyltransferase [Atractiella rhizophila]|nr:S-adenosyl-L-methionine-dependent methyltransferase [Atractiella rhizophila]
MDHGTETFLDELASPRELFLLNDCGDIELSLAIAKEECQDLSNNHLDESFCTDQPYFYRHIWDPKEVSFRNITISDQPYAVSNGQPGCASCARKREHHDKPTIQNRVAVAPVPNPPPAPQVALEVGRVSYHVGDYVYLTDIASPRERVRRSDEDDLDGGTHLDQTRIAMMEEVPPFLIAQILDINGYHGDFTFMDIDNVVPSERLHSFKCRLLLRSVDLRHFGAEVPVARRRFGPSHDSRLLVLTNIEFFPSATRLRGKCVVCQPADILDIGEECLQRYRSFDDTFFFAHKLCPTFDDTIPPSMEAETLARLRDTLCEVQRHHFVPIGDVDRKGECISCRTTFDVLFAEYKVPPPLGPSLDVFGGLGGYTLGLETSGAIKIDAEENWGVEAHVATAGLFGQNIGKVIAQDANAVLRREWNRRMFGDRSSGKENELMDKVTSEVVQDLRERFQVGIFGPPCQAFTGLNRFASVDDTRTALPLTALCYTELFRFDYVYFENVVGLLAHSLGGQQSRAGGRVRGGIKTGILKFMLRCLMALGMQVALYPGLNALDFGTPQSRRRVFICASKSATSPLPSPPRRTHSWNESAPLRPITVQQAIDDLPPFEYRYPKNMPKGEGYQRDDNIQAYDATNIRAHFVGEDDVGYLTLPMNDFQTSIRPPGTNQTVRLHVTKLFRQRKMVARICSVAKHGHPDLPSNHESLPMELRPKFLDSEVASTYGGYRNTLARLDPLGCFQTSLTRIDPSLKLGRCIHSTQNRVMTVREQARAQGIPDWYDFGTIKKPSNVEDIHMAIGNAVPIPVGNALGRANVRARMHPRFKLMFDYIFGYQG